MSGIGLNSQSLEFKGVTEIKQEKSVCSLNCSKCFKGEVVRVVRTKMNASQE